MAADSNANADADALKERKEWKKMKVQQLRDELSTRGLSTTGLRPSLIDRLHKFCSSPSHKPEEEKGETLRNPDSEPSPSHDDVSSTAADANELEKKTPSIAVKENGGVIVKNSVSAELGLGLGFAETAITEVDVKEKPLIIGKDNGEAGTKSTNGGLGLGALSELEKKHRRAERFGMALHLTEEEKRKSRAARFSESSNDTLKANAPGVGDTKVSEEQRRKVRAERFGLPIHSPADDEARKKARLARFGIEPKLDTLEEEKRKTRTVRFASVLDGSTSDMNKKLKSDMLEAVAST